MQIGVLLSRQKSFIKRTLTFSRLAVDFCQRKNSLGTCNSVHYGVQQVQASPNFLVACLQWQERKFQRWLLRENGEQERGIIHAVQSSVLTPCIRYRLTLILHFTKGGMASVRGLVLLLDLTPKYPRRGIGGNRNPNTLSPPEGLDFVDRGISYITVVINCQGQSHINLVDNSPSAWPLRPKRLAPFSDSHHHLSPNREGRWGTTDDFATSFLHFSLFSTALCDLPNSRPCPFPDVVFPPLPLSALSSSPSHCALQDGFGQTWWTWDMTIPLQFA